MRYLILAALIAVTGCNSPRDTRMVNIPLVGTEMQDPYYHSCKHGSLYYHGYNEFTLMRYPNGDIIPCTIETVTYKQYRALDKAGAF